MNRADFMKNLEELLADMAPAEREEAIQYYNDYFDDAGEENEQSVIESLGTPEQLARTIKAGLFDGGNAGEFTEKGFSGYEQRKHDEVMDLNHREENGRKDGWQSGQTGDNGQRPGGESGFGNADGNGFGSHDGKNRYGTYEDTWQSSGQRQETKTEKKKMSGGMIALIVILCIFASPVLLGVGGGAVGVIVGLLGALIGILAAIAVISVTLLIVGVILFVFGIVLLFGTPLGGLCMIGSAMICLAVGLCFLCLTVAICGWLIPAVIRGIVKLVQSIFRIGGAKA